MSIFNRIYLYFDSLDAKTWYRIIMIYIACVVALCTGIIFLYYRASSSWHNTVNEINESRVKARMILKKAERVYSQRQQVNRMILEDPDFKITGHLQELMNKTGIASSLNTINTTQIDREEKYREIAATLTFTGTSMRQLTEFLQAVEQNKRLHIKDLEISKSKKTPHAIDATVIITTMLPRQSSPV